MNLKQALNGAFCAAVLSATAPALANLVTNGNFSAGNTGFGSDYGFSPAGNGTEGQYTVRTNPSPWNSNFVSALDHTNDAARLMFVGNGSPTLGERVWFTLAPIAVTPGTDYFFEAFVMNVCCLPSYTGDNSPSILGFYANGVLIGTRTTSLANVGLWEGLSTNWNSGAATSVSLELKNANIARGGNDFAVDDIFLGTTSTVATIPVPAALPLLASGLVAFGFIARRRKSA
ncbi:MAG: hypothetical protein H7125_15225 [Proteobacteria bacterium]|nr:hypothetical protein [Burkholderiales bacterium]